MKVLYLTRKKIKYAKDIYVILKKKFSHVDIIYSKKPGDVLQRKFNVPYDYTFSYRSYIILKSDFLKKIKYSAINFHPAPPSLRGFAPASFAIIENLKKFGSTIHEIDNKLDHGPILSVKYFKIPKNINIKKLLDLTYESQILQIKYFFENFKLKKNKKYKWSKKIHTKKQIDRIMYIKPNYSKTKVDLIIRATKIGKFKPYTIKTGVKKFL